MGATVLEVKDIHAGYGGIRVLKGVNLRVGQNEIVTLIGANGAGKTTLLRVISGVIGKSKGQIIFRDRSIDALSPHKIVRNGLVHVQEGRGIFKNMTVMENLRMGAYARKDRKIAADLQTVFKLFPRLEERQGQLAGTLSGGEQQMVAIGRAFMSAPTLLLMDEPSLGLAPILVTETFKLIARINEEGISILLVEQNARISLQLGRYGYVLENGVIRLEGNCQELLKNPDIAKVYLGGAI